jgi:tetratricopeptide (TPR) repeat protein
MTRSSADTIAQATALTREVPTLVFLVRKARPYDPDRRWGIFDSLGVRGIDDLTFVDGPQSKTIVAYTEEPPYPTGLRALRLPAQVAFERIFFHIQGVSSIVLNPRKEPEGVSELQAGTCADLPKDFPAETTLSRAQLPLILGAYSTPQKKISDLVERAEKAYRDNSLFEAYHLARRARADGVPSAHRAWFVELMALSFLGLPQEAMELYEEYPLRGSSEPEAQLVAGRYRLLLKQLNEARTILHGLTFHAELGAFAATELARSYLMSAEFDRAIDLASEATQKAPAYLEARLIRGIAQRGISYESGDEEGLRDALKDLESVARQGDFSAPEALFHAGTILGRLGVLDEAEIALRQSLFRRDRYSSRDALVRVLCASGKMDWAREELELVCAVAPSVTQALREEIESHSAKDGNAPGESAPNDLWHSRPEQGVVIAQELLRSWRIPLEGTLNDCATLDDFINRYAPAGDFLAQGPGAPLHEVGEAVVARVFTLYVGDLLVRLGGATWDPSAGRALAISTATGGRVPLESFVQERLLLGASGDNFSNLESLAGEFLGRSGSAVSAGGAWWELAASEEVADFGREAAWGQERFAALGGKLTGTLGDLEEIDRVIEHVFEPGGALQEFAEEKVGDELDRFVASLGLVVGQLVVDLLEGVWYRHEQAEGVSVFVPELGRIFPIARLQRRVYLSSAADTTQKLMGFAFGLAAGLVTRRVRAGVYTDRPHVVTALRELLPQVEQFSEEELEGVADSLLKAGRSL